MKGDVGCKLDTGEQQGVEVFRDVFGVVLA